MSATPDYLPAVRAFFDRQYAAHDRYWWRGPNRYSTSPADHTSFNAAWLAAAARRGPGLALDPGAGEGADAIRLARLGYQVDAVDVSAVACDKAEWFARAAGVDIRVRCESIETAGLTGTYNVVPMNGCLHYVRDKDSVLARVVRVSAADAVHAVALFSTATPVPAEHTAITVFPDEETGLWNTSTPAGAPFCTCASGDALSIPVRASARTPTATSSSSPHGDREDRGTVIPAASDLRRARLLWDYLRLGAPAKSAECLLVLGGHDIGVASRAAELYAQRIAPLIVVSGGSRAVPDGSDFPTEADAIAALSPPPAAAGLGRPYRSLPSRSPSTSTWPGTFPRTASCPTWRARHSAWRPTPPPDSSTPATPSPAASSAPPASCKQQASAAARLATPSANDATVTGQLGDALPGVAEVGDDL